MPELISGCAGVAGMGRVVLEAVSAKKPVVLIGYDGVKGVVREPLFVEAAFANFSGRGLPIIGEDELCRQFSKYGSSLPDDVYAMAKQRFDEKEVWNEFVESVRTLPLPKPSVFAVFYGLLRESVSAVSDMSIYGSVEVVEKFSGLLCSEQYYDARLVQALHQLENRLRDDRVHETQEFLVSRLARLELDVAEYQREIKVKEADISLLQQEKSAQADYLDALHRENEMMKRSLSWRLTRPIRGGGYLLRDPGGQGYRALKELFWALPPGMRNRLHGTRHRIVRWMRYAGKGGTGAREQGQKDLSWDEFYEAYLADRSSYKGVFIQLSTIPWHASLYQRPQHMALAMAQLGYLVIFKTPVPGGDDVNGFREVVDNVWITDKEDVHSLSGAIRSVYSTDSIIEPRELDKGPDSCVIYEYIDHIDPLISGDDANIRRLERLKSFAFSGGADIVVSSASVLHQEAVAAVGEGKCVLVPNGVDVSHYRGRLQGDDVVRPSVLAFRHRYKNIVGYF